MPRLTYCPSRSSWATRAASWVRVKAMSASLSRAHRRTRRHALDALSLRSDVHDALHEDAWQMHELGVDRSRLDEFLDFGHRYLAGHRAERIEVTRGFVKEQVAGTIADRCAHERVVANDSCFQHVFPAVEDARLLLR